jgi:hypothetical protein
MKAIWKFPLKRTEESQAIALPKGALFRSLQIQIQNQEAVIWFEVDTNLRCETRMFRFFFTGSEIPENCKEYLGTLQLSSTMVVHLYEEERVVDLTAFQFQIFTMEAIGEA